MQINGKEITTNLDQIDEDSDDSDGRSSSTESSMRFKDGTNDLVKKEKYIFTKDLLTFNILCLYKDNRRKFQITQAKQAQIC